MYHEDEGGNVLATAPRHWVICWECNGEGKSSAYLGSFTQSDIDEDPEWFADYMDGAYDRPCHNCHGSGKVKEIDFDACTEEQKEAIGREAEWQAERNAEQRMREQGYQF